MRAVVASLTEISRCTIALVEAVSDLKRERAVKRLEKKLGPWFKWQGRVLIAALPKLVRYFPEPVEESRLLEALGSDFDSMFDKAIKVTVRNGEEIFEAGLVPAVSQGYTAMAEEVGMQAAFKLKQPEAVRWASKQAAVDVALVNDTTKETIRGVVTRGLEKGASYDEVARQITKRFNEFAVGKPQAHIQSRAHLVAINENAVAYEEGRHRLVDDIMATGIAMEKKRAGPNDNKTSDGCLADMAADWIPESRAFPSGIMYGPRFPGCRHDTQYRVSREG